LVANLSAPELRHLAAELARRGLLQVFVTRYANQRRVWEQTLERLPVAGRIYSSTLGLRQPPAGIGVHHIVEAGIVFDFAAAIVARFRSLGSPVQYLGARLHQSTARAIGRTAAHLASRAPIIVAGSGAALPAFEIAAKRGALRVLNYPSAHHRFQQKFFAAAAKRQPEFAGLSEHDDIPLHLHEQLDQECALADLILTGSRFARNSFVAEGIPGAKVLAIPYGVDLSTFTPGTDAVSSRKFRITYVGRISSRKGIGYLLHAYQRFCRPDTELHLVGSIVGDGACLRPYANLFVHSPHMPQFKLLDIYRQTDVFVFPSLLEGLGLVVLEAMACGCPVIVSANGPCDVVRDGIDGLVVPAESSDALESALARLYGDRVLRASMAKAARIGAEAHSWNAYAAGAIDALLAVPSHQSAH